MKELFEEFYCKALLGNIKYQKLVAEGNKLISSFEGNPKFKILYMSSSNNELLIYKEMLRHLTGTIDIFVANQKIKNKYERKLAIKSLKKQYNKIKIRFMKTDKEHLLEMDNYVFANIEFLEVATTEDKKNYIKLLDIEDERFLLEIDLMFEVMLTVSKFLLGINKLKGFENNINEACQPTNN